MGNLSFYRVAGTVFAIVALAHLYRAVQALPIQIGSLAVPQWVSWIGVLDWRRRRGCARRRGVSITRLTARDLAWRYPRGATLGPQRSIGNGRRSLIQSVSQFRW